MVGRSGSARARASASIRSARSWPPRSWISAPTPPRYSTEQPLRAAPARRRRARGAAPRRRPPRSRRRGSGRAGSASRRCVAEAASPPSLGVGVAQPPAVLQLDHLPARRLELPLELVRLDDRDDAVEALPVQVDDPEHVAEPAGLRLDDRLPEVALVELGVAEQGDEPAARCRARSATRRSVARARRRAARPSRCPTEPVE